MRAVGFDHVGVFTYSHEEGTTAHDLRDDVPAAVKTKRRNTLMAEQKRIVARAQKRRVGSHVQRAWWTAPRPNTSSSGAGRLTGQAPDIDPVVYFTEADLGRCARARCWRPRSSGSRLRSGGTARFGAVDPLEAPAGRAGRLRRGTCAAALVINFQVRKSLQDLKWAGAHFLFLRVVFTQLI